MFIDIFHGPQGAGKDTQATLLIKQGVISAFSVGAILRKVAKKRIEISKYLLQGTLVPPDELANILIEYLSAFLEKNKCEHIILTGFPRSLPQIKVLDNLLKGLDASLGCVFYFKLRREQAVKRITNRYTCPKCGRIYNLITNPPKYDTTCDFDGSKLVQRADDTNIKTIETRLQIFELDTLPVIEYFRKLNCVFEVDASKSIRTIHKNLVRVYQNFVLCNKCSYK